MRVRATFFVILTTFFTAAAFCNPLLFQPVKNEQVIEFMIAVDNKFPGFFDTSTLDNPLRALEKQVEVYNTLQEKALPDKSGPYLNVSFIKNEIDEVSYDQSKIEQLRKKHGPINSIELQENIKNLGQNNSQAFLVGLTQLVPVQRQKELFAAHLSEKLKLFKELLPEELISAGFKAQIYGIQQSTFSKEEALDFLNKISAIEERIVDTAVLLEFEKVKTELPKHLVSQKNKRLKEFQIAVNLQNSETSRKDISLLEMPVNLAILRGCAGGDCATSRSFPFPNSPNEKVFAIQGTNGLKGYLSFTLVSVNSAPAIYLHTISGPMLSKDDVLEVIKMLAGLKTSLKANSLVLPHSSNIDSLMNYESIRNGLKEANVGAAEVAITYDSLDKEVREILQKSIDAHTYYDKPSNNTHGLLYEGEAYKINEQTNLTFIKADDYFPKRNPSVTEYLEFYIRNARVGYSTVGSDLNPVMESKVPNLRAIGDTIGNIKAANVEEYKKAVLSLFEENGLEADFEKQVIKLKGILLVGLFNCKDILAPANKEMSAQIIKQLSKRDIFLQMNATMVEKIAYRLLVSPQQITDHSELQKQLLNKMPEFYLQKAVVNLNLFEVEYEKLKSLLPKLTVDVETAYSTVTSQLVSKILQYLDTQNNFPEMQLWLHSYLKNKLPKFENFVGLLRDFPKLAADPILKTTLQNYIKVAKKSDEHRKIVELIITAKDVNGRAFLFSDRSNQLYLMDLAEHPLYSTSLVSAFQTLNVPEEIFKSKLFADLIYKAARVGGINVRAAIRDYRVYQWYIQNNPYLMKHLEQKNGELDNFFKSVDQTRHSPHKACMGVFL